MHPDDLEATRAAFAHAFATGEPIERQQRIRRSDGAYRCWGGRPPNGIDVPS
jgi:hypothetical protein